MRELDLDQRGDVIDALFEAYACPAFLLDRQGCIVKSSKWGYEYIRRLWNRELVLGQHVMEYSDEVRRTLFDKTLEYAFLGNSTRRNVVVTYPVSNEKVPYEIIYQPIGPPDAIWAVLLIARDHKELQEAEVQRDLYERALACLKTGVAIADARMPDMPIVYVNEALCALTGYTRDEILERNMRFLQGPQRDDVAVGQIRQALREGESIQIVLKNHRKDGTEFDNLLSLSPLYDGPDEPPRYYVAVQEDVTELLSLERMYVQSQKMEALGQLAAGVAHDFNNMLAIISMNVELEAMERGDSPELQGILATVQRASGLTSRLLAFAKPGDDAARPFDVARATRDMTAMLDALFSGPWQVSIDAPSREVFCRIESSEFEQIVLNLAVNAKEAMPNGGHFRLGMSQEGDDVVLCASDTGVGMSAAVLDRIFEPFFTTKGGERGSGLGLSTVYGISQRRGGGVSVESTPGRGSTFTVRLPASKGVETHRVRKEHTEDTPRSLSVLVLVGDDSLRRSIQRGILAHGHDVVALGTKSSAAAVLGVEAMFDVVVTEPTLSNASITGLFDASSPPAIVISGFDRARLKRDDLLPCTTVEVVQKPFDIDGLSALCVKFAGA